MIVVCHTLSRCSSLLQANVQSCPALAAHSVTVLALLPSVLLPFQPLNPLLGTLYKLPLPLLYQEFPNSAPTHQHARHKQRCHKVPASLRGSTDVSHGVKDLLEFGVISFEVKCNVASCLLARALKYVTGVIAVLPVALASVVGVVDDLGEHE